MFTAKNKFKPLLGTAIVFAASAIALQFPAQAESHHISNILAKMSQRMNRSLPKMLDRETSMDSTSIEPGRTFNYNISFINRSATDIDGNQYTKSVRPSMVRHICDNLYNPLFREGKVSVSVRFHDSHRNFFGMVKVEPAECK